VRFRVLSHGNPDTSSAVASRRVSAREAWDAPTFECAGMDVDLGHEEDALPPDVFVSLG
jgi:hypothetical protein